MTVFNESRSSSDKFSAIRACLCKKQCVHCAIDALSLIRFTTPELIQVHAAAPLVQIPAQFSQDKELSRKNPSRLLKISSPLQMQVKGIAEQKVFFNFTSVDESNKN